MRLTVARSSLLLSLALVGTAQAATAQRLCGWYQSPDNTNPTLTDHSGVWGLPADSAKPIFRAGQWVSTEGGHGYGCACFTGNVDASAHTLSDINRANARTLASCRADAGLSEPKSAKVAFQ